MKSNWQQLVELVENCENPNDKHTLSIWIKRIALNNLTFGIGNFAMAEIKNGRGLVDAIELAMYEWDI